MPAAPARCKRHAARRRPSRSSCGSRWRRIAAGDTFAVTAGCDKQFATCRAKFANAVNFRGFPHMPGNDFVAAYPRAGRRQPLRLSPFYDMIDTHPPTRDEIVAHARAWIGTPYHHQASRIGVGTDCLGLVRGVCRELYGREPRRCPPTPATGPKPPARRPARRGAPASR